MRRALSVTLSVPAIGDLHALRDGSLEAFVARWASPLDRRLHALLTLPIRRISVGAEFCSLLLPGPGEVKSAASLAARHGLELGFVTPPMPQNALPRVRALLSVLGNAARAEGRTLEVTVGDLGTLRLIAGEAPHLRPVLGRVLAKLRTDTQLSLGRDRCFSGVLPQYQRNSLTVSWYRAFLRKLGVERVELDWPEQGLAMDLDALELGGSLHLPFVYTTCGRRCLSAASPRPLYQRGTLVTECRRECREVEVHIPAERSTAARPRANEGFVMRGNSVVHRSPALADATIDRIVSHGFDRIVLSADRGASREAT